MFGLGAASAQTATTPALWTATDLTRTFPGQQRPLRPVPPEQARPLVLIHGLGGWGVGELFDTPYWGISSARSIVKDLRSQGYKVFEVSVGPISSNWERAAEAYAQLKGGCVDYGPAYAQRYGLKQFDPAKCYPGLYPQWDAQHPVNIIGHSMGGITARMLVKLLEDGSPADARGRNLFAGGRVGWVRAVMTVSTPNSGTPATDHLAMSPFLKDLFIRLANSLGGTQRSALYDFDLGQWGLRRQMGESLEDYAERIAASPFGKNRSNASYDLSVDGMAELNTFMGRSARTVYASWATSATTPAGPQGWAYPNPFYMRAALSAFAWPSPQPFRPSLGNMVGYSPAGKVKYDPSWWENDGLVPVKSQGAPLGQSQIDYVGGPIVAGQWYHLGKLAGWDHTAIIGAGRRDVRPFYRNQAAWLANLP